MKVSEKQALDRERWEVLQQLEDWLDVPMLVLSFIWLVLFIIELTVGLSPILQALGTVIWTIFILDFAIEFTLAPRKLSYLKNNWLTVLALVLPALRILRLARLARLLNTARATRGLNLVRVMIRTNRGMRALGASMNRRGFGYIMALTGAIALVGAAGMYAFEKDIPSGLSDYGTALWWTAMLMTTMGSEYWPQSPEGRILCLILALYAFAVFGYVTAALATFLIGRDAEDNEAEIAGAKSIDALHAEIKALRHEIQSLSRQRSQP